MHEPAPLPDRSAVASSRAAAIAIALAAVLAVAAMSHHPTASGHGGDLTDAFARIRTSAAVVHGIMIAVLAAWVFGFWIFAERLGLGRPVVRAGLVAFALGAGAHVVAATLSGFVAASFAASHGGDDPAAAHRVISYGAHMNQAFAQIGVVAMSVAIGCWSLALLRDRAGRLLGGLGLLVGLVPAVALPLGMLTLDVHGMGAVVLGQAVWSLGVAWLLLRGQVG